MLDDRDLFTFKKECLFQALQRNLEWAKRTNEIAMQAKKWCIAYWLIYVGFFAKDTTLSVSWLQIAIGLLGICFFLAWELVTHYYSELITEHRFQINRSLSLLPNMTREDLLAFDPLPTAPQYTWTRKQRMRVIISMLSHETLIYFYFGLALFMLVVFFAIRHR